MRIFIGLILFIALFFNITLIIVSDDKRVYTRLNKKELYRLSIVKDTFSAIIIISLALLAFV